MTRVTIMARVSVLIGVPRATDSFTRTLPMSSGEMVISSIDPTPTPLSSTSDPLVRPRTEPSMSTR